VPRGLLLTLIFVVLLRVPFLDQAIQGDDIYYLAGAEHAQIDPLHPNHARYAFLGQIVPMQGHPHPPLNAWFLGLLLAIFKDVHETTYHAAYVVFSLIAAAAAWSLARRFSPQPLAAALLVLATPAFVVNGNSLEADVPFLAFWLAAVALFISAVEKRSAARLAGSMLAMVLAALAAYQAVVLTPVLALYLWLRARSWRPGWLATATPIVVLGAWQLLERLSTGALPAAVLAGFFQTYGLQSLNRKLANAAALTAHLAWVIFPALAVLAFRLPRKAWIAIAGAGLAAALVDFHPLFWLSIAIGVLILIGLARKAICAVCPNEVFLSGWCLSFFAAALVLFFAGSARYLLPAAAPVALMASRALGRRPVWLWAGLVCQLALAVTLARTNYEHWEGYRRFARLLAPECQARRVWINGEWGLRFYLEAEGALPLLRGQAVQPGEVVVSSSLAYPVPFTTGGGELARLVEAPIQSRLPLRLIGLGAKSAFSSASFGLRPFDWRGGPLDLVRAEMVVERPPRLEYLPMSSPEAEHQILSGVYQLEEGRFRWMGRRAVILLKSPSEPAPLEVLVYLPEKAPARRLWVELNDELVLERELAGAGVHALVSPAVAPRGPVARLVLTVDRTFWVPGDHRELGVIVSAAGFRTPAKTSRQPSRRPDRRP